MPEVENLHETPANSAQRFGLVCGSRISSLDRSSTRGKRTEHAAATATGRRNLARGGRCGRGNPVIVHMLRSVVPEVRDSASRDQLGNLHLRILRRHQQVLLLRNTAPVV